jgi:hypothetical protein
VVWFTGMSISLNAVSGRSAMGMTETKVTAVARRRRNAHLLRFDTHAPRLGGKIPRWQWVVKDFLDYQR